MKPSHYFAIVFALLCTFQSRSAQADVVLTFSEPDFEWLAQGGQATPFRIWTEGDYWRQNFASTGLNEANRLELTLDVNAVSVETLNMDVFINSVNVGDFVLDPNHFGPTTFEFSFSPIIGDSYFVELVATSTISIGRGAYSIRLDRGLSTATLSIPEPSTSAIFGTVAIGTALIRRRR